MSKGQIVNQSQLAETFGTTMPTVRAWVRRGCPVVQRGAKGKQWQFNTAEVAAWREQEAAAAAVGDTSRMDLDESRRRKEAANAAMAEIDLAKRRGELVEVEHIAEIVGDEYSRLRQRLLGLPVKIAPMLDTAETLQERREIIEDAIVECLAELSADDDSLEEPTEGAGEAEEDEAGAAAAADG